MLLMQVEKLCTTGVKLNIVFFGDFVNDLGPVVRRPISTQSWGKFNPGLFSFSSKAFSWIIFSVVFKNIQSSTC